MYKPGKDALQPNQTPRTVPQAPRTVPGPTVAAVEQ